MRFAEKDLPMRWWYNLHGRTAKDWDQILEKIPTFVPPNKVDIVRAKLYDCDETFSTSALPARYAEAILGYPPKPTRSEEDQTWDVKPHPARNLFPWFSDGLVLKQSVEEMYHAGFQYRPSDVSSSGV